MFVTHQCFLISISKSYNHSKILHMMRSHCIGELIRPAQTRFATNYVALSSLREHKNGLQRMVTSEEWQRSAASCDSTGRCVHSTILDNSFWKNVKRIVDIHAPIAKVLRMVDGEKQATMPYVYAAMCKVRLAIQQIAPKSSKRFIDVIDHRWHKQIISHIHMACVIS